MPIKLKVYSTVIFAVGITAFFIQAAGVQLNTVYMIVILAAIAGLLDKFSVELPNGRLFAGSGIFTFVTLMCFGLPEAMIIELTVALTAVLFQRTQLIKVMFNIGQFLISIAAAGMAFGWAGGISSGISWNNAFALPVAMAVYYVVNISLLSVIFATLFKRSYHSVWLESIKDALVGYVVTLFLSVYLAFTYHEMHEFLIGSAFIFVVFLALRYSFGLFINLRKTYLQSMESLTHLTEDRLSVSVGHASRTGRLAREIAEQLKLPQEEIDAIHYAALFHDLGKGQINGRIFQKRGPLTLEEEKEYRKHVLIGADLIKEISGLEKAAEYVRYHHELWDGKGFPEGKSKEAIPLGARIIAAANEYDHIVYQKRKKDPAAEFKLLANHKLDPKLVDIVLSIANFAQVFEQPYIGRVTTPGVEATRLMKAAMKQAQNQIYESPLLKKFGASLIAVYDGEYRDEQGMALDIPCEAQITALVLRVKESKARLREYIACSDTGKIYELYCIPSESQIIVMLFDVSHILEYELKQEERITHLYRDVISSVTQGKFLLTDESELAQLVRASKPAAEASIKTKNDIGHCRSLVQDLLEELGTPQRIKFNTLLCTSEAATNVLKHATDGHMKVFVDHGVLRIIIADTGSGIDLVELPKSILFTGYSTKVSMGHGFSLILKLTDRVLLQTGQQGTTIVMEMKLYAENSEEAPMKHRRLDSAGMVV